MNEKTNEQATGLQVFNNPKFGELRTSAETGSITFCLTDVCRALNLKNAPQLQQRLKKKGIYSIYAPTNGGQQEMLFIDEPNLYRCIFQSRKKEASEFQDWVFEEVLPSIRKSGGYIATKAEDTPEEIMAKALIVALSTIERNKQRITEFEAKNEGQQLQIEEQKKQLTQSAPKVQYYDDVLQSTTTMTTTQIAKGLGMEANKLNKQLEKIGILFKQSGQWLLHTPFSAWNMHSVRTLTFTRSDGTTGTRTYTVFNERGKMFITALANNDWNIRKTLKAIKGIKEA